MYFVRGTHQDVDAYTFLVLANTRSQPGVKEANAVVRAVW